MRILHTADWHLGSRLGRIDRSDDLRRAVERVAHYCEYKQVDVLLIAGDIFSELTRPENLRASIEHLREVFERFLLGGGTILAITGNHDNENFCQTLGLVMKLAAPASTEPGDRIPGGRLYLATNPTFLRLADRSGLEVQFILMPYPTPTRYLLDEESQKYASVEEKNRHLQAAYARRLRQIMDDPRYARNLHTVLCAHVHVQGAVLCSEGAHEGLTEAETILFQESELPTNLAYVALGHIHQPQKLMGLAHVRYSGSIERMNLGEQRDDKGVVLFDLTAEGLRGEPEFLPLEATPIYSVELHTPLRGALELLRQQYPDAKNDLVRIDIRYTAGEDNLEEALRELEEIFPRWYARNWSELGAIGASLTTGEADRSKSFEDTVRDYLKTELMNHPEAERDAVLALAEALMKEVEA
jgi:exonuclease SbcD